MRQPKKQASKAAALPTVVKTSMYIPGDLKKKVEYIDFMDDSIESQSSFMLNAIRDAVAKWEKTHGEAVKK